MPMNSNTRGGAAIDLFAFLCQGDPTDKLLQWRGGNHSSAVTYVQHAVFEVYQARILISNVSD